MTKERVEELIKQKATIYDRETTKIMLDKYSHVYQDYLILGHSIGGQYEFYLRDLFETEEQALWVYKTAAEYVERFEPPMWDDIKDKYDFVFYNKEKLIFLDVFKTIKPNTGKGIQITSDDNDEIILESDATKENYEKACEIIRDLFIKRSL